MSSAHEDLQSFTEFVHQHDASGRSLPELFDLWMMENVSSEEYAENVQAINASIRDFLNGERGTPAGEHSQRLREEFGAHNQ